MIRVKRVRAGISVSSASIVVIELESGSLRIILFLEEAFKASSALKRFWPTTGVSCLSQNRVEVRISLRQLWITLLNMLMSGEILSGEVWPHVVQFRALSFTSHGKSILKWVSPDSRINRVSPLESTWLLWLLKSSMVATRGWARIIILMNKAACHGTWNTCNLGFEIFV